MVFVPKDSGMVGSYYKNVLGGGDKHSTERTKTEMYRDFFRVMSITKHKKIYVPYILLSRLY